MIRKPKHKSKAASEFALDSEITEHQQELEIISWFSVLSDACSQL